MCQRGARKIGGASQEIGWTNLGRVYVKKKIEEFGPLGFTGKLGLVDWVESEGEMHRPDVLARRNNVMGLSNAGFGLWLCLASMKREKLAHTGHLLALTWAIWYGAKAAKAGKRANKFHLYY